MKTQPMTNLIARCTIVTGSANASNLLMRIAYWMPKASLNNSSGPNSRLAGET